MKSLTRTIDRERAVILLIVLAAFFIRLYKLNTTSLWYDETFVLHFAQQGVVEAVRRLFILDNAIPLHGLLMALWIKVAGNGEFVARLSSVFLSTLTCPLVYHLSRELAGRKNGAWWGAAAFAVMPIYIYYGQEVRMYALAMLLAAAFSAAYVRLLRSSDHTSVAAYVLLGVTMMTTHLYTGLLWAAILVAGVVTFACFPARRASWPPRVWLIANGAMAIASIPIVVWALWRARIDATGVSAIPINALRGIPIFYGVGQYLDPPWPALVLGLIGITLIVALAGLWRSHRWHALIALLCGLAVPVLLLVAATLVKAKWSERYLLPSMGLALTVGLGVAGVMLNPTHRPRHWLARLGSVLIITGLCSLSLWASLRQAQGTWALAIQDEWHPRPDFRGTARYIEAHTRPGDAIAVVAGYAAHSLAYYYGGGADLFGVPPDTFILDTQNVIDLSTLTHLEQSAGSAERLWLVLWQDRLADPLNIVQSTLVDRCDRLPVSEHFTNIGVLYFDISTCRPLDAMVQPRYRLNVSFTDSIVLKGYNLIKTGETWEVDLWWQSQSPISKDYTVFVHLRDASASTIAQHDHIAGDDAWPSSRWGTGAEVRDRFFLTVPGGECKDCELYLGLYTETGRLPLIDGSDAVRITLENK